jgi:hypothetical protein
MPIETKTISIDPRVKELSTPSSCYSPEAIRAFLRYSRKQSDDVLATHLPRTGSCAEHISTVLFPAWLTRDSLLVYCEDVANKSSTDQLLRPLLDNLNEEKAVDPRKDAYRARDFGKKQETGEELVRQWVDRERSIEAIIRDNSVRLLAEKCGSFSTRPQSYLTAYEESVYDPYFR